MSEVFVSYAREDQAVVERVVEGLEAEGLTVWWDHAIPPGKTWDEVITRGIEEAKACIIIWSPHSVGSDWVKEEATLAKDGRKYLPVQIDAEPPMGFRRIQAANLTNWNGDNHDPQWRMLVREAMALARGTAPVAATVRPARRPPSVADLSPELASKSKTRLLVGLAVAAAVVIGGGWWASNRFADSNLAQEAEIKRLRAERDNAVAKRDASINTVPTAPRQSAEEPPLEKRALGTPPAAPATPAPSNEWAIRPNVIYAGAIARRQSSGSIPDRPYEVSFDPGLESAKVTVWDSGNVYVTLALRGSWNGETFTGTTSRVSGAKWDTDAVTIVKQPGGILKWTHSDGVITGMGTLRPRPS